MCPKSHTRRRERVDCKVQRLEKMYNVFVRFDGGEFLFVASREESGQAARPVLELNSNWPREHVVGDSTEADVFANIS